jgi:predicted  nucleic acid-binding Zn-ribbon protein
MESKATATEATGTEIVAMPLAQAQAQTRAQNQTSASTSAFDSATTARTAGTARISSLSQQQPTVKALTREVSELRAALSRLERAGDRCREQCRAALQHKEQELQWRTRMLRETMGRVESRQLQCDEQKEVIAEQQRMLEAQGQEVQELAASTNSLGAECVRRTMHEHQLRNELSLLRAESAARVHQLREERRVLQAELARLRRRERRYRRERETVNRALCRCPLDCLAATAGLLEFAGDDHDDDHGDDQDVCMNTTEAGDGTGEQESTGKLKSAASTSRSARTHHPGPRPQPLIRQRTVANPRDQLVCCLVYVGEFRLLGSWRQCMLCMRGPRRQVRRTLLCLYRGLGGYDGGFDGIGHFLIQPQLQPQLPSLERLISKGLLRLDREHLLDGARRAAVRTLCLPELDEAAFNRDVAAHRRYLWVPTVNTELLMKLLPPILRGDCGPPDLVGAAKTGPGADRRQSFPFQPLDAYRFAHLYVCSPLFPRAEDAIAQFRQFARRFARVQLLSLKADLLNALAENLPPPPADRCCSPVSSVTDPSDYSDYSDYSDDEGPDGQQPRSRGRDRGRKPSSFPEERAPLLQEHDGADDDDGDDDMHVDDEAPGPELFLEDPVEAPRHMDDAGGGQGQAPNNGDNDGDNDDDCRHLYCDEVVDYEREGLA